MTKPMTDERLKRYRKMFEDAEATVEYWRVAAENCHEIIRNLEAEVERLKDGQWDIQKKLEQEIDKCYEAETKLASS